MRVHHQIRSCLLVLCVARLIIEVNRFKNCDSTRELASVKSGYRCICDWLKRSGCISPVKESTIDIYHSLRQVIGTFEDQYNLPAESAVANLPLAYISHALHRGGKYPVLAGLHRAGRLVLHVSS